VGRRIRNVKKLYGKKGKNIRKGTAGIIVRAISSHGRHDSLKTTTNTFEEGDCKVTYVMLSGTRRGKGTALFEKQIEN